MTKLFNDIRAKMAFWAEKEEADRKKSALFDAIKATQNETSAAVDSPRKIAHDRLVADKERQKEIDAIKAEASKPVSKTKRHDKKRPKINK